MTGLPKRRDFCEARGLIDHGHFTNQAIIVKTLESKSLLPSLYKREEFPSLKKGLGEIFIGLCLFYYGLLNGLLRNKRKGVSV
jgi:hypothetical protein